MSAKRRLRINIDMHWLVRAEYDLALQMSAATLWGQMRDVERFCAMDPLHRKVTVRSTTFPPRGAGMVIQHRLLGVGPDRVGRILRWREGRGYAFSDLSQRGTSVGFPHVCAYEIRATAADSCVLTISARGIWTQRLLPRILVRAWLGYVLCETARCIRSDMHRFMRWRRSVK